MIVWLKVPFQQKDEARRLGAQWNDARRLWYVENIEDLRPFMKWIDARVKAPTTKAAAKAPKHARPIPVEWAKKKPKKGLQKIRAR